MNRFSAFLHFIAAENRLDCSGSVEWLFLPGMLFGSSAKWWGDFKERKTAHEGVDIVYFRDTAGRMRQLDTQMKIPSMAKGVLCNTCDDFLGQTLVIETCEESDSSWRTLMVYAHIKADPSLSAGDIIQPMQILGHVHETVKNPQLPPHLHFSCFSVPRDIPFRELNWTLFCNAKKIVMIPPFSI